MNVIHVSAECYPVAKVGGLGDVVGALPKYQQAEGVMAMVVMPYFDRPFVHEHQLITVFESQLQMGPMLLSFSVLKEEDDTLGFPIHFVKIPGLLDRPAVYAYSDETEQFVAFQLAVLDWIRQFTVKPDLVHCHDHHTGLIPFLMTQSSRYETLRSIPTILTIHNAEYQGWIDWSKFSYLPEVNPRSLGLLDWNGCINSLAAGVKCCWRYTTVSPSYLEELKVNANGLEPLFLYEQGKSEGIINGIDVEVWDPKRDSMIASAFHAEKLSGKTANKKELCKQFGFTQSRPLIAFIGRLVLEKGADLLAEAIALVFEQFKAKVNILVLGSGEKYIEEELLELKSRFPKDYHAFIGYDESLSHQIYAGADFILMPSRVEPCGLNQLYSMRYGTIPVVRATGGLKDTVSDVSEEDGYGIRFTTEGPRAIAEAIVRATELYANTNEVKLLRKKIMGLDFSWNRSAREYIDIYKNLNNNA